MELSNHTENLQLRKIKNKKSNIKIASHNSQCL